MLYNTNLIKTLSSNQKKHLYQLQTYHTSTSISTEQKTQLQQNIVILL